MVEKRQAKAEPGVRQAKQDSAVARQARANAQISSIDGLKPKRLPPEKGA